MENFKKYLTADNIVPGIITLVLVVVFLNFFFGGYSEEDYKKVAPVLYVGSLGLNDRQFNDTPSKFSLFGADESDIRLTRIDYDTSGIMNNYTVTAVNNSESYVLVKIKVTGRNYYNKDITSYAYRFMLPKDSAEFYGSFDVKGRVVTPKDDWGEVVEVKEVDMDKAIDRIKEKYPRILD